jgi:4-hydroxybenzoate polyprenyltransferase
MRQMVEVVQSTTPKAPATIIDRRVLHVVLNEAQQLLIAMRLKQWLKNGLVLLAVMFSVGEAWYPFDVASWAPLLLRSSVAFVSFCAVASAAYLVNDIRDIERDRVHPVKRWRPLASGVLQARTAIIAAGLLFSLGIGLSLSLGAGFAVILAAYVALTFAYSLLLKDIVIVDLFALSTGFVIRAAAGAIAIAVPISSWLYLCTFLGALFIAINKRRHELTLLSGDAMFHRPMLAQYTVPLLDQMTMIVASSSVLTYALYTTTAPNMPSNHAMVLTVPFVMYGVFRYLLLVHGQNAGGSPEEVLLHDRGLQLDLILWLAISLTILAISRL